MAFYHIYWINVPILRTRLLAHSNLVFASSPPIQSRPTQKRPFGAAGTGAAQLHMAIRAISECVCCHRYSRWRPSIYADQRISVHSESVAAAAAAELYSNASQLLYYRCRLAFRTLSQTSHVRRLPTRRRSHSDAYVQSLCAIVCISFFRFCCCCLENWSSYILPNVFFLDLILCAPFDSGARYSQHHIGHDATVFLNQIRFEWEKTREREMFCVRLFGENFSVPVPAQKNFFARLTKIVL